MISLTIIAIVIVYRSNLIANMHRQYIRTGYIWEQYDDDIGKGKVRNPNHNKNVVSIANTMLYWFLLITIRISNIIYYNYVCVYISLCDHCERLVTTFWSRNTACWIFSSWILEGSKRRPLCTLALLLSGTLAYLTKINITVLKLLDTYM